MGVEEIINLEYRLLRGQSTITMADNSREHYRQAKLVLEDLKATAE